MNSDLIQFVSNIPDSDAYSYIAQVGVQFLQALNHFQRYAYVRQAHARESRPVRDQATLPIPPSYMPRTPSNRSESSLTGG